MPNSKISFAEDFQADARNYRVDCNFIAQQLSAFKPQWTCRRGIEQLYDAYYSTRLSLDDFEGERYKRIAHIQKMMREGSIDKDLRPRVAQGVASHKLVAAGGQA